MTTRPRTNCLTGPVCSAATKRTANADSAAAAYAANRTFRETGKTAARSTSGAKDGAHFFGLRRVGLQLDEGLEVREHLVRSLQRVVGQTGIVMRVRAFG